MKPTKIYRPKSLVLGYKLAKDKEPWVAVPSTFSSNTIIVKYKDETMLIKDWHSAAEFREFEDKFGRGSYQLAYFKWEPQTKQRQLFSDKETPWN